YPHFDVDTNNVVCASNNGCTAKAQYCSARTVILDTNPTGWEACRGSFYIFQSKLALAGNLWGQPFWAASALQGGVALDRVNSGVPANPAPYPNAQAAIVSPHTRASGVTSARIS